MEERIKTQMMWTVTEKVRKYVEKFSLIEDGDVLWQAFQVVRIQFVCFIC